LRISILLTAAVAALLVTIAAAGLRATLLAVLAALATAEF